MCYCNGVYKDDAYTLYWRVRISCVTRKVFPSPSIQDPGIVNNHIKVFESGNKAQVYLGSAALLFRMERFQNSSLKT